MRDYPLSRKGSKIRVNCLGCLERLGNGGGGFKPTIYRDWWLIKNCSRAETNRGILNIGRTIIYLPREYIGKKVRIKLEVVKE